MAVVMEMFPSHVISLRGDIMCMASTIARSFSVRLVSLELLEG